MSKFIKHEPCPDCGSKDNVAVYDDGHKWCFGCGYHFEGDKLQKFRETKHQEYKHIHLPEDFTTILPNQADLWLSSYNITNEERKFHKIGWSNTIRRLIFPFFSDNGDLLFWQGRGFYDNQTKYITFGNSGNTDIIINSSSETLKSSIVVVEDFISAIVVGRVAPTIPLFGCSLSDERLTRLANLFDNLVIWLDHDKRKKAVDYCLKAKTIFKSSKVRITHQDPKELDTDKIKEILSTVLFS